MRGTDLILDQEVRKVLSACAFLWRIRHSVHYPTGRKTEHLSLDMQPNLAGQFGYNPGTYLLGSEKLMRDYYRHARELHLFSEDITARVADTGTHPSRRWLRPPTNTANEPLKIRSGQLHFE